MPAETSSDQYDSPWKTAVEHAFPEFIDFYFPHASRQIDWRRGYTFLDKELQSIVRDAELGRRHVDKLVSITTHAGEEDWLCIHIEVQGSFEDDFARRMFVYNHRIFDAYNRPVVSLAVLADDAPDWRPDHFSYTRLGCEHSLRFPIAKLLDHLDNEAVLLATPNPFALVTAAHLYTRGTRKNPAQRFDAKRRLVRLLYLRDWPRQRILDFFGVLDWMMRLPDELEHKLWQDIENIEGERKVRYVTSVERLAIKRGLEKGLEQGLEQGLLRGREEGQTRVLARQLTRRFGTLPAWAEARLNAATEQDLDRWTDAILDATSLTDVLGPPPADH